MMNLAHASSETCEKIDIAAFNLRVAEKSIELTAFQIALVFLEAKMDLLLDEEDVWFIHYDFVFGTSSISS